MRRVTIGAGRRRFVAESGRLTVKRIAIGRRLLFVTTAAFFRHFERKIARRSGRIVVRDARMTIHADRSFCVA